MLCCPVCDQELDTSTGQWKPAWGGDQDGGGAEEEDHERGPHHLPPHSTGHLSHIHTVIERFLCQVLCIVYATNYFKDFFFEATQSIKYIYICKNIPGNGFSNWKRLFRQLSQSTSPPCLSLQRSSSGCSLKLKIEFEVYGKCCTAYRTACQRLLMLRWSTSGLYLHSLFLGLRCILSYWYWQRWWLAIKVISGSLPHTRSTLFCGF